MADTKITALAAIATVDPAADVLPIVDISDTSMAASGTTKKVTSNQILGAGGTATLASATITGAATVGTTLGVTGVSTFAAGTALLPALTTTGDTNTGIYYPAADTFAVTTGGTERYRVDSAGQLGIGVTPSVFSVGKVVEIGFVGNALFGATIGQFNMMQNAYFNSAFKYANTSAASYYQQLTGQHVWYNAPSGTAGNNITFTQAMTLDASGNLLVGVTSANANGGVLQLKSGITFPATQVAASDANTLDDYEEGTWTPTVGGTWISSPTSLAGTYTKVGRIVTIQARFSGSPTKASSTSGYLSGLPFNVINEAVGSVSDDSVSDKGNCLAANSTRIWLTDITFGSGTTYVSVTYTV